jgi:glycosyltransferase involved in cell wall biosynthesis
MRVLVVVPTYNEAAGIATVVRRIHEELPAGEVLVVDDNSPDGTGDLVRDLSRDDPQLSLLARPAKAGLGSAYLDGFAEGLARGVDVLVEMDADLSHDPAALPALVSAVQHGADLAIGSRYVAGGLIPDWTWQRAFLSRWGNRYAALVLGLAVNDSTSGYRAYRADALRRIDLHHVRAYGYGFQVEMTYRLVRQGGRVVEIPVAFVDRQAGESKMSWPIVVEAFALVTGWGLRDILTGRRRRSPGAGPEPPAAGHPHG